MQITKRFFLFFIMILIIVASSNVMSAVLQDPSLSWKTLHTPHFHIHYHDGEDALAKETAVIAERVHERLTKFMDWVPHKPTEVILTDRMDFSNGWATPLPRNTMNLIVSPPDDVSVLEDYSDWLELLITHEYTHILHLDKATGFASTLRKIFGRQFLLFPAFFPNAYQPSWILEGLATYTETDLRNGIGRGQSNSFRALMRMEVEGGVKPITQVNQPMITWPAGTSRYLYGVYFMNFIRDEYGEEKLQEWIHNYSDNALPFFINRNASQTFGKSLGKLWLDFTKYLNDEFKPELEHIRKQGLVDGTNISNAGYYTGNPRSLANGDIYYVQNDFLSHSKLMKLSKGESKPRFIANVESDRFDLHPTAGIIMARVDIINNASYFSDLRHIDIRTGSQTQLTKNKRYIFATWSPKGDRIVAVHNNLSEKALHLLDANGKLLETLWTGDNKVVISQPDWSPDGNKIVASVWRPGSHWNLETFSMADKTWKKITNTKNIETQPQYTKDGSAIIFCADYDGVYNVRKLELNSGKVSQLSNVLGGVFSAAQLGDGDGIVYMGVSPKGYDVFKLDETKPVTPTAYNRKGLPAHVAERLAQTSTEPTPYNADSAEVSDYNGLSRIVPTSWFPLFSFSDDQAEAGVFTWGTDPLNRHIYEFTHVYDYKLHYSYGAFDYIYDRWNPSLKLSVARDPEFFLNTDDELTRTRISETISAELIYPILKRNRQLSLHAGVLRDIEKDKWLDVGVSSEPEKNSKLYGAAVTYNSVKFYPRSISQSEGQRLRIVAEDYDSFKSDYTGKVYIADWRAYFDLGKKTVLATRLAGGRGTDNPKPFRLGGYKDGYYLPSPAGSVFTRSSNIFNQRDYALRGYKEGKAELSGDTMGLFELEVRFPIMKVERGTMFSVLVFPTGIHQIYGRVFYNVGDAWDDKTESAEMNHGTGFEVNTEIILGYMFLLDLRAGVAYGLDSDLGDTVGYVTVGTTF